MKNVYRIIIFSILIIGIFSVLAFADEPNDLSADFDLREIISQDSSQEIAISLKAAPVTPNTSNGFHKVIISLLGNYEPITVDYEYRQGSSSYTSHNITTAPDWSWVCSAAIFALVLLCTFKFLGGIFKHD